MRSLARALFLAALSVIPRPGFAAVTCNVSPESLAFGSFNPLDGAPRDSTSTITVGCTWDGNGPAGVGYTIGLSAGSGGSGFSPRRMSFGPYRLDYNLYSAATYSGTVWGDGTAGTQGVAGTGWTLATPNIQETRSHTVYGRIVGGQRTARVGSYADSIVVTVTY